MHTSTVEGGLKTLSFSNSSLLAVFSHKKYICSILPSHEIVRNGPASHLKVNGRVMAGIKTHVDGENGAFEETAEAGEFHSQTTKTNGQTTAYMSHDASYFQSEIKILLARQRIAQISAKSYTSLWAHYPTRGVHQF
jgi:hypothetical protein